MLKYIQLDWVLTFESGRSERRQGRNSGHKGRELGLVGGGGGGGGGGGDNSLLHHKINKLELDSSQARLL